MSREPTIQIPAALLTKEHQFLDVGFRGIVTSVRPDGLRIAEITTQNVRRIPFRSAVRKGSELKVDLYPNTGRITLKGVVQSIRSHENGGDEISVVFQELNPEEERWVYKFSRSRRHRDSRESFEKNR